MNITWLILAIMIPVIVTVVILFISAIVEDGSQSGMDDYAYDPYYPYTKGKGR